MLWYQHLTRRGGSKCRSNRVCGRSMREYPKIRIEFRSLHTMRYVRCFAGVSPLRRTRCRLCRWSVSQPVLSYTAMARNFLLLPVVFSLASCLVYAHSHHDNLTDEQKNAPVDAILWIHMSLQALVWGLLFPAGMVLGITRSRWHVPLQVCFLAGR